MAQTAYKLQFCDSCRTKETDSEVDMNWNHFY